MSKYNFLKLYQSLELKNIMRRLQNIITSMPYIQVNKKADQLVIVMTVSRCTVVVQATRILRVGVLVDGLTPIFLGEQFLDFPGIWLHTDGEFQVFLSN